MIEFKTYASSSKGNCYTVSDGKTKLMIECGIPIKQIKQKGGFKLHELSGCLCTHEHLDHIKAAKDLMKSGIDVWTSRGTAEGADLSGHRLNLIESKRQFKIGSFTVLPFNTVHDVSEPLGFLLSSGASAHSKLLFITDSQYVPFRYEGLAQIAIECNYSMDILKENVRQGRDRAAAKITIRNHMSLETVKEFFKANDMSKVREIHLLHLSDGNSDAEMFRSEIQKLTGRPVYIGG